MPSYYIAADGGGSKLQAILYDDSFRILRSGCVAGVNTLFKPKDVVQKNIDSMIRDLLTEENGAPRVPSLKAADLCMVGAGDIMRQALERYTTVENVCFRSEPIVGLAAAFKTQGAVALSGTGSDAFFVKDGMIQSSVGGWGPLLGDEGSGYDIGLRTLKAAIYASEGRGEKTAIYDLVMEKWDLPNLWGIVTHLAGNPDARHEVASAARLCAKAAAAGDRVALRIYEIAALEMVYQTRTVIDRHENDWDGSVVIMGGSWKGHPSMFGIFKHEIELLYPGATVHRPCFEPVVGCAVLRCLHEGLQIQSQRDALVNGFSQFLYP